MLKNILTHTLKDASNLGGAVSETLKPALEAYRQRLFWMALMISIVVIVIIGFGVYLIALHVDKPEQLPMFSAALGVSAGGGVEILRRLWSEWSRAGLLALLIEDSPESVLTSVTQQLVEKL